MNKKKEVPHPMLHGQNSKESKSWLRAPAKPKPTKVGKKTPALSKSLKLPRP